MEYTETDLLFLSKAQLLWECPRKYHWAYHRRIALKEEKSYLAIGKIMHRIIEIGFNQGFTEGLKYAKAMGEPLFEVMYQEFAKTFDHEGCKVIGCETSVLHPLDPALMFKHWVVKTDALLLYPNDTLWLGEWKTTDGYGPATMQYYHQSAQTVTYNYVLKQHMPVLNGTKIFVITKKNVRCLVEPIPVVQADLNRARSLIEETQAYATNVVSEGLFRRNQFACTKVRGGECAYKPVCFETNERYIQDTLNLLYVEHNPHEHLDL